MSVGRFFRWLASIFVPRNSASIQQSISYEPAKFTEPIKASGLDATNMRPNSSVTATAVRLMHTVKPHKPMIQFSKARMQPLVGASKKVAAPPAHIASSASTVMDVSAAGAGAVSPPKSRMPPVGYTPRGSGIDEMYSLPRNFRRRFPAKEEIDLINRGGRDTASVS